MRLLCLDFIVVPIRLLSPTLILVTLKTVPVECAYDCLAPLPGCSRRVRAIVDDGTHAHFEYAPMIA